MVLKPNAIVDISKPGAQLQNLSGTWNARVLDGFTPFVVQFQDNGMNMNLEGLNAFIEGDIGQGNYDATTDDIVMAPDAAPVRYVDDGSGNTNLGIVVFRLPPQFFVKKGLFNGYIGLQNSSGIRVTSNNVWFKVLGSSYNMGIGCKYFIADFQKALEDANGRINKALDDLYNKYNQKAGNAENGLNLILKKLDIIRSTQKNLTDRVEGTEQQIAIHDIVTVPQYQQDIKTINDAINQRLATIRTAPTAVENSTILQNRYPNGADGIFITADTGHKWLWLAGKWVDSGNYQAAGLADEIIQPINQRLNVDEENISDNNKHLNQNIEQTKKNTTNLQDIQGAGKYKDVYLVDEKGRYLTDQFGNKILGKKWLPLVDTTLTQSDIPADAKAVGDAIHDSTTFKPEKYGIPVLYLWGQNILSLKDKSKSLENEVTYSFPKYHVQGKVNKFKVQGSSSARLPKKNYTLNLDQDFEAFSGFGKQHKYVIKANYTDASQALNVVNAKLWGKIRNTHYCSNNSIQNQNGDYLVDNHGNHIIGECDPQLSIGSNYGAVDGFPIAVYINDKYWGLYSFNIPKDDWMAKMPKKAGYAIVDTVWSPQGALQKRTNFKDQMELQFCGTKDKKWVQDSINKMIDTVIAHYDRAEDFDNAISSLIDLDSAYDYYIYSVLVNNDDGIFRNYLLQTFNGTKWYFAAYDLDSTFGRTPDFLEHTLARSDTNDWRDHGVTFENVISSNRLFYQLWKFHKDEILNRTKILINTVMSVSSVDTTFIDYVRNIPQIILNEEIKVWPDTPNTAVDNVNRIGRWYMERIAWLQERYFSNESNMIDELKARVTSLEKLAK